MTSIILNADVLLWFHVRRSVMIASPRLLDPRCAVRSRRVGGKWAPCSSQTRSIPRSAVGVPRVKDGGILGLALSLRRPRPGRQTVKANRKRARNRRS